MGERQATFARTDRRGLTRPEVVGMRLPIRRNPRALVAAAVVLAFAGADSAIATSDDPRQTGQVGQQYDGATLLPDNQLVSPVGVRTEVDDGRMISSALSPDGTKLAALTSNAIVGRGLTIIDVKNGKVLQQVGLRSDGTDSSLGDGTVAADGPMYSPDGKSLWMSQATDVLRLAVNSDGTVNSSPVATIAIKATHGGDFGGGQGISAPAGDALPSGTALSQNGRQLYVAINGNNTLGVIDTQTNQLTRQIPVGMAPRQVVVHGNLAYVSDEGGRRPKRGDKTNFTDYSKVVSDPKTGAAKTGAVSVVDLRTGREAKEIPVGLAPAAMLVDGADLLVVNTNNDSVSVIDLAQERVVRTLQVEPLAGVPVGSNVNAIMRLDARHLLLSLGRDNAIAEYDYSGPQSPFVLQGLIPTDWYPVAVQRSSALGGQLVVTSGKGRGARGFVTDTTNPDAGPRITHLETSSVEVVPLPGQRTLTQYTTKVWQNNGWSDFAGVNRGAGDTVPSVIPRRLGDPSPIKHVFLIVKENRTYDQVLGDLGEGNGDPTLAEFGAEVTPNNHALAARFGDLDNFYDEATLSADGHNWVTQANANDYDEGSFGSWARSYPASGSDALAYQRSGFIWQSALDAGMSVRNYGEYVNWINVPSQGAPTWDDWYKDSQIMEGKASGPLPVPTDKYRSWTDVPALNRVTNPSYPLFDLDVPDQYRVDIWERDFKAALKSGKLPNLTTMTIMSDHTATSAGTPGSPPNDVSEVADNDLALGRIVSDVSHSKFWKSTAIFVVEDDSQAGVDHVDGHRAPMFVISPYSKTGVDSTYYTQLNMVRTIEQLLGLSPMNQGDANAVPMYDAFTSTPNLAPYDAQSNIVPLTLGTNFPAAMRGIVAAWEKWGRNQHFGGARPMPDVADPMLLNHYDWYAAHGWRVPYPGEVAILTPRQLLP